jgi:hypothetical protein
MPMIQGPIHHDSWNLTSGRVAAYTCNFTSLHFMHQWSPEIPILVADALPRVGIEISPRAHGDVSIHQRDLTFSFIAQGLSLQIICF